jgi:hypothetical protein
LPKQHGTETAPPEELTNAERMRLSIRLTKNLPQHYPPTWPKESRDRARLLVAECLAWHEANGRWRVDWVATAFQWISKHHRDSADRKADYRRTEYPQEKRTESVQGELVRLADYIGGKR